MVGDELVAAALQTRDLTAQSGDGLGEVAGLHRTSLQHGRVVGRWDGGADGLDALAGKLLAAMVFAKEPAEGAVVAALQMLQVRPLLEQVGDQRCIHVEPLRQLRKVLLQAILQAQRQAGLVVHELAAIFDQHQQQAGVGVIGREAAEAVPMPQQQIQNPAGIGGIVFGARGYEGLAVGGRHRRGHGEQHQVRVRQKQVHNRSSLLFQGDGHGPTAKALVQTGGPDRDGLWRVVDEALISFPTVGGLENPSMFLAAPI